MKESYYFPHDYNAHSDPRIMNLIMKVGLSGVGLYWILIEILHNQEDGHVTYEQFEMYVRFYSTNENKWETLVEHLLNIFFEVWLFVKTSENLVYSSRVLKNKNLRKDIQKKRSEAWKKSAQVRQKKTSVEQKWTSVEQNPTKEKKGKEILISKDINNNSKELLQNQDFEKKIITQEIDLLISEISDTCESLWVAYDKKRERFFAKHILTSTEYWEFCEKIGQERKEFAKNILIASERISFWRWVCSGPMSIYQNYSEVYNKVRTQKKSKEIINIT